MTTPPTIERTPTDIRERIQQHRDNLALWESGYLAPTEPDEEERTAVMRELRAAIAELSWVLGEEPYR